MFTPCTSCGVPHQPGFCLAVFKFVNTPTSRGSTVSPGVQANKTAKKPTRTSREKRAKSWPMQQL